MGCCHPRQLQPAAACHAASFPFPLRSLISTVHVVWFWLFSTSGCLCFPSFFSPNSQPSLLRRFCLSVGVRLYTLCTTERKEEALSAIRGSGTDWERTYLLVSPTHAPFSSFSVHGAGSRSIDHAAGDNTLRSSGRTSKWTRKIEWPAHRDYHHQHQLPSRNNYRVAKVGTVGAWVESSKRSRRLRDLRID